MVYYKIDTKVFIDIKFHFNKVISIIPAISNNAWAYYYKIPNFSSIEYWIGCILTDC